MANEAAVEGLGGYAGTALVAALLAALETGIVPETRRAVAAGNKIFGAALLRKSDLSLVLAAGNAETANPLWHGEVNLLRRFYELPAAARPPTRDLVFLSSHEPCSLCLSAITWAGFDNFFYLFGHEDSRDSFAIPHDLRILKEVFGLDAGGYRERNAYWASFSIPALIASLPQAARTPLSARVDALKAAYAGLSAAYQAGKADSDIPLR